MSIPPLFHKMAEDGCRSLPCELQFDERGVAVSFRWTDATGRVWATFSRPIAMKGGIDAAVFETMQNAAANILFQIREAHGEATK